MLLIIDFSRNSPSFWLFLRIKLAFSHLGLNPIATTTCIWSSISHTEGKVQIGKEPSLKYYPFLLLMYLHLFEIAVYLSLRTIEEQTEFQFAFRYRFFVFFRLDFLSVRRTAVSVGSLSKSSSFQHTWILPVQIPDSKTQNIPDFSFWFAPNFCISFSRNDFNSEFRNWRTCYVNACLSTHISITTFDNYKKYITENQEINFSSKNTYWDCPFLKSNVHSFHIFLATLKKCTIFLSFRFLKVLQVI